MKYYLIFLVSLFLVSPVVAQDFQQEDLAEDELMNEEDPVLQDCIESDHCRIEGSAEGVKLVKTFDWKKYAIALQGIAVLFLGFIELNKYYLFEGFFESDRKNRILYIAVTVAFLASVASFAIILNNLDTLPELKAGVSS